MTILNDMNTIFENREKLCEECRNQRKQFNKYDKKYGEEKGYSDFFGGFGEIKKNVDVFVILDSHGGGRVWKK